MENSQIWEKVLKKIESQINKQSFNTWLKDTQLISNDNNVIKILVTDDVAVKHVTQEYLKLIENILETVTQTKYNCQFITDNNFSHSKSNYLDEKNINLKKDSTDNELILNPNYTFNNFIVGSNNQFAHAAANSVAQNPGKDINPLFIYGESGLGKTHLLQAIGHHLLKEKPYLKIMFVRTEQFISEFVFSIRKGSQESFKIKYRDVDILLIDDIQFLENKDETQNEFFHTFNALHQRNKQIVISSDRPPKNIATLTDRLRTRFEGGLLVDIKPPNLETREAILRLKAENENFTISDEAYYYMSRRIQSNIRSLEAAINRLRMVAQISNNKYISIEDAKNNLKELFDVDANKNISISDIMNKVAGKYNVTVDELISKNRQNRIIIPRHISMYLSRQLTELTTSDIGRQFGNRDHSTVVSAVNKIIEDMKKNIYLKEQISEIVGELKS